MAVPDAVFPDAGLAGFVQTLHMLRDDEVQRFVADVQAREELELATDREAYLRNLEKHGLEDFAEEALGVAARHWKRRLVEEMEGEAAEPAEELAVLTEAFEMKEPAQVVSAMLRFVGYGLTRVAQDTAQVISRYIVAGFIEVPRPIGPPSTVVTPFPVAKDEHLLLAVVTPYSDIQAVVREIRSLYSRMFVRGKRQRLPDKARETLWLRYCAEIAGRGEEIEAGRYRYLAELYFELHPKQRPRGQELEPAYERELEKHAQRIRKNSEYWEKKLKPYFVGSGENEELTSPSEG